ncbi:MAG: hypothetical protein ACTHZ5_01115 [Micrococcaceae bacterium]
MGHLPRRVSLWSGRIIATAIAVTLWIIGAPALSLLLLATVLLTLNCGQPRPGMAPRRDADLLTLAREAGR